MATTSVYPGAYDANPPGWPFTDYTEYLLASYANYIVSMIQALENTLGFGTGASTLNPLYSQSFNETFTTVTARMAALEGIVEALPPIDTSAGDIQPVGTSASAGNSGKNADAKHVHVGVRSINGRSGVVTLGASDYADAFTAAGQLIAGTGNGTGEILAAPTTNPTTAQYLQQGGADPSTLEWGSSGWDPGDVKWTTAITFDNTRWLAANGQTVSRTQYPNLLSASTLSFTGTASSTTISGLTTQQTAVIAIGMAIEGPGLSGATVTGVASTSITVSSAPTGGSHAFQIFPYGNGNGSTTFNVVDMRGRTAVGTGGPGGNAQPTFAIGATGGEQNHLLSSSETPIHTHPTSDPGHTHTINDFSHRHSGVTGFESNTHTHVAGNEIVFVSQVPTTEALLLTNEGEPEGNYVSFGQLTTGPELAGWTHAFETDLSFTGVNNNPSTTGIVATAGPLGGGSTHNNMQPYAVGQWLVKI